MLLKLHYPSINTFIRYLDSLQIHKILLNNLIQSWLYCILREFQNSLSTTVRPPCKVEERQYKPDAQVEARRNERQKSEVEGRGEFRLGCARPGNALDAASPRRMSHRRYGKPVRHDYKPFPLAARLEPIRTMASSLRHSFFSSPSFLPRAVGTSMGLSRLATMPSLLLSCCFDRGTKGGSQSHRQSSLCHIIYCASYRVQRKEKRRLTRNFTICLIFWFLFFI